MVKIKRQQFARRQDRPKHPNVTRGGPGTSVAIPRSNYLSKYTAGVSQSIRRTLAWSFFGGLASSSAYAEQLVVILNSPYDPDNALGGTQPLGFAKYMALYSKCFTLAARTKLKYAIAGTGNAGVPTAASAIGMSITTNSTSLGSLSAAVSNGMCDYHVHNVNPDSGVLTLGVDIAKFVDKPDILDDPQFFCTVAANPTQVIVLHVWTQNNATAITTFGAYVIEVEFDVVFTDPIPFT